MKSPFSTGWRHGFRSSSLIIGWESDAGKLGEKVTQFLVTSLKARVFTEIEPLDYFSMGHVSIEDDIVQFPESKIFACPEKNLVIFRSAPPTFGWYRFFNQVLDIVQYKCYTREIYLVGGIVSPGAHTSPRELIGTFNFASLKRRLAAFNLIISDSNFETPPGQKPSLNSFFLWTALKRNIPAVNLWTPVPFYLMSVDDPRAQKKVLSFFDRRFELGLDLAQLDDHISRQNMYLNEARIKHPDIDNSILKLERNLPLHEDENLKLERQVEEYLKSQRNN